MKKAEREEIKNTATWLAAVLGIEAPKITFPTKTPDNAEAVETDEEAGTIRVYPAAEDFIATLNSVLFGLRFIWQVRVCPLVRKGYKEPTECETSDEYFRQEAVVDAAAFGIGYIEVAYHLVSNVTDISMETAQAIATRSEIYADWLKKVCVWIKPEEDIPNIQDF